MYYLDFYGTRINLNLNKKEKIKTKIGVFLTIITFILVLFFSWLIGEDLAFKKKPTTNQFKEPLDKTISMSLKNNSQFFLGIGIQDYFGETLDIAGYFEIEAYNKKIKFNKKNMSQSILSEDKIDISYCKLNSNDTEMIEDMDSSSLEYLNGLFCLNYENLQISGSWAEDSLSYISIIMKKCNNTIEGNDVDENKIHKNIKKKCKSKEEIQEFLIKHDVSFNIYYFDNSIILDNYENPVKYYLKNLYYFFQLGDLKYIYLSFHNNSIITDDAFIFDTLKKKIFIRFKKIK